MEGRSGLFGRALHVNHQLHPAGGDGAGAGGRGGLLRLGSEQRGPPPQYDTCTVKLYRAVESIQTLTAAYCCYVLTLKHNNNKGLPTTIA